MDSSHNIIQGRKFGGVACLWDKSISHIVKPLQTDSKRVCGVTMKLQHDRSLLMLSAYLPCDNYSMTNCSDEFMDVVSEMELIIEDVAPDMIIVGGDLNIDLSRDNAHSNYIADLCSRNNLCFCWHHNNAKQDYTFVTTDMRSKSCIDHFLVSDNVFSDIESVSVIDHVLNPPGSWHRPIQLVLNMTAPSVNISPPQHNRNDFISWKRIKPVHYEEYKAHLSALIECLDVPHDALNCNDLMCDSEDHKHQLDKYCSDLIELCVRAGNECFPKFRDKKKNIPYWREEVEPKRQDALFWGHIWNECGRPSEGVVADLYRKCKREYHYAVRHVKRNDSQLRKQRMLENVINNDQRNFWNETKKLHSKGKVLPSRIDDAHSTEEIVNLFGEKYKTLFNSVPSDSDELSVLKARIRNSIVTSAANNDHVVHCDEVQKAARKLKPGKADGDKGLYSNHIKMGPVSLHKHISNILTGMFIHGTNVYDLLIATISSLPKDKSGDFCSSNNYRGISLLSAIAKIYDLILIDRYGAHLSTSELQYSFKHHHSTVMCHTVLRETVNYYMNRGSNIYACFLDASKAFDRVRYDKLFTLLEERGLPPVIIRSLMDQYERQMIRTSWNGCYSEYFSATNGIRQGGVLSPILYTVYADELIRRLAADGTGCHIGHRYVGIICYADDIVLLSPSRKGLQNMLNICQEYGAEYSVKYNERKSMTMCFTRQHEMPEFCVKINGEELQCVSKFKHVGIYVTHNLSTENEMKMKRCDFICRVNHVLSQYSKMPSEAKCRLINSSCCHYYGCETWNFSENCFNNILTSWNIAIRQAWRLPYRTHSKYLPVLAGFSAKDIIYQKFLTLYNNMYFSKNGTVQYIAKNCEYDARSLLHKNITHISTVLKISTDDIVTCKIQKLVKCSANCEDIEVRDCCNMLIELNHCLEGLVYIPGFSNDITNEFLFSIATS